MIHYQLFNINFNMNLLQPKINLMEKLIICHNLQIKDLHKKLKNYNSYVKILTNKKNKEYNNINKV